MHKNVALRYARDFGFAVFPLIERGKLPAVERGFKVATTDEDRIDGWWSERPACNIGLATGAVSGIWVLDVDGPTGEESLAALIEEHGPLPRTSEQTSGKGRHICFSYDPERDGDLGNRAGFRPNLDTRANGGYIVVAPSVHPNGGKYTWHPDLRPTKVGFAPAPAWLLELVRKPKPKAPTERKAMPAIGQQSNQKWIDRALANEVQDLARVTTGSRNAALNTAAFKIGQIMHGDASLTEGRVITLLLQACASNGLLGDDGEAQCLATIQSGLTNGQANPREIPEPKKRAERMPPAPVEGLHEEYDPETGEIIETRSPPVAASPAWADMIVRRENAKGEMKMVASSQQNFRIFLTHHWDMQGVFVFDAFANQIRVMKPIPDETRLWTGPRLLTEGDDVAVACWLETKGLSPSKNHARDAIMQAAMVRSVNPAQDFLYSLRWDGTPRLDAWLTDVCGVDDQPIHRAFASKYLISAVARVMQPGCKVDTMLILEGAQGLGKSTVFRELARWGEDSYFTDQLTDIQNKDAAMQLGGKVIVEVAELSSMRRSDVNAWKGFITVQVDSYRPPYGSVVGRFPRTNVFGGTVNPDGAGYLNDPTGARRFWPVRCGDRIRHDLLAQIRDQLWAEAFHRYQSGEVWWLTDAEEADARTIQADRREEDAIHERALSTAERLTGPWGVGIEEIMDAIELPVAQRTQAVSRRIVSILTATGWSKQRARPPGQRNAVWRYYPPAEQASPPDEEGTF